MDKYKDTRKFYENLYKENGSFWGKDSSATAERIAAAIQKGTVLDLGCGTGRNAIYLAQKGLEVIAVDFSIEGIMAAKKNAEKHNVTIDFRVADITDPKFASRLSKFDATLSSYVINCLTPEDGKFVLNYMKENTKPEGWVAISAWMGESSRLKRYAHDEMYEEFQSWKIRHYEETEEPLKDESGIQKVVRILAQKPNTIVQTLPTPGFESTGPKPWDD